MAVTLESLDLAALLCSRVCHDLISPAGAIVNGLEVLEESDDEETKTFALTLIKKSARTATARLQFCRIAFGAAGSITAQVDTGDAEQVARGFIEDEKVKLTWNLPRALLPKNRVKLLLNMLVVGGQAIPRGGSWSRRAEATEAAGLRSVRRAPCRRLSLINRKRAASRRAAALRPCLSANSAVGRMKARPAFAAKRVRPKNFFRSCPCETPPERPRNET